MSAKRYQLASLLLAIAAITALVPILSTSPSVGATSTTQVYLTPASQAVTVGGNVVVTVMLNTGGASINTVQSQISYSAANFSVVSVAPSAAFTSFPETTSSGAIQFSAGTSTPVSGSQITVATITLHSTSTTNGASNVSFNNSLCGATGVGYTLTCTAAYDGTTSANDLIGATTPIANGSYTVNAPPVVNPPSTPSTPSAPSTPKSTTSTSSSSTSKSSTGGTTKSSTPSSSSTPAATTPAVATPSTTPTNPVPVISDVAVSNITATSATVTWQTNIAATSVVNYGLTPNYGLTAQSGGLTTNHEVKLGAPFIVQGTTYYIEALSASATGASATGGAQQFTARGFTVTISVVDSHGQPIKGAIVSDGNITATTNGDGIATLQNVPAGAQSLIIKSGDKTTKRTITVGKLDPKTGTYQSQKFSLTATRGHDNVLPYIIVIIVVLVAAGAVLFASPASARRLLKKIGKGPGSNNTGPTNGGSDIDLKPMSTTVAPESHATKPIQPLPPVKPESPVSPIPKPAPVPEPKPEPEDEPKIDSEAISKPSPSEAPDKPKDEPKPGDDTNDSPDDDSGPTVKPNHRITPNDDNPAPGTIIPPDEDQI